MLFKHVIYLFFISSSKHKLFIQPWCYLQVVFSSNVPFLFAERLSLNSATGVDHEKFQLELFLRKNMDFIPFVDLEGAHSEYRVGSGTSVYAFFWIEVTTLRVPQFWFSLECGCRADSRKHTPYHYK